MKLSIITINYNNRDGLQKTVDSVVSQTYKNFEWIVIDGGSTDGSRELIEKYQEYFAFWCSEPDKGIYNAMNKGIKVAQGEYLLFLNSGDYLVNSFVLEDVVKMGLDADIVFGYIRDSISNEEILNLKRDNVTLVDLLQKSLPHSASFIRRELFDIVGLYDEKYKIVSDWKFFVQAIIIHNVTLKYIPLGISYFDASGISSRIKRNHEYEQVLSDLFPPRILCDLPLAVSLSEIYARPLFKKMYSILYRICRSIGY